MPTYTNPYGYTSPIGEALGNLGRVLFSGPSQAEKIKVAEEALKLKRIREGMTKVSDLFAQFGTPGFDRNAAMSAAVMGEYDPANLGELELYGAANKYGAADPRTDAASRGAGGAYSSTAAAFGTDQARMKAAADATLAENRRQFDMTPEPALMDGKPVFKPRSGVFDIGVAPILSETDQKGTLLGNAWENLDKLTPPQHRVLGADASGGGRTPFNYSVGGKTYMTIDGVTDVQTGLPLPRGGARVAVEGTPEQAGLTTSMTGKLQGADVANENLSKLIAYTRQLINESPDENFGATAVAKGAVQNLTILASNLASGMGFNAPADALRAMQEKMLSSGVEPSIISGIFDPRLGQLQTAYSILIYATASALAGQNGRDLSNEDVKRAVVTVGDPRGWFSNKPTLLSKLDTIEQLLKIQQSTIDERLAPNGTSPETAPTGQEEVWERGPDGLPVRVK